MPRCARIESPTGYYHIIQRGMGKQVLFETKEDHLRYIHKLKDCQHDYDFDVIAYCLMNNHVHLLLRVSSLGTLSELMHTIGTSYANYYNLKYAHSGSVFQSRFKSLVIENDEVLLKCVRYIHNNPLKAGFSSREDYPYSSYISYITGQGFIDKELVINALGGLNRFIAFSSELDDSYGQDIIDDELGASFIARGLAIISHELDAECSSGTIVKQLNIDKRNDIIHKLKINKMSTKEIELLTGVSKSIIKHI